MSTKLRRLVLRLKPGESFRVELATGLLLAIRRDASDSNKFMFEEMTALEDRPYFIVHHQSESVPDGQFLDGWLQHQRWLNRFGGEVSGGGI